MRIMNIAIITISTIAAIFILWIGLTIVLSLDSAFHETRKAKPLAVDINAPGNRIIPIGHSTVLIQLDGLNIITDPIFSNRILYFSKRYTEPGIPFEKLPKIDAIVISHEHYDHFDKATLKKFDKSIPIVVSIGLRSKAAGLGFQDIREIGWWDSTKINSVKITAVPVKHFLSHASSYVIEGTKTVYFASDTGLNSYFEDIGRKFNIDAALLPMGAYRPHLSFIPGLSASMRGVHMSPEDVPIAQNQLKAKVVVPIHWGVFKITAEPIEEPREKMEQIIKEQNLDSKIKILEPGEIFNL